MLADLRTDDCFAPLPILTKSDSRLIIRILPAAVDALPTRRGAIFQERNMKTSLATLTCLLVTAIGSAANGQATTTYEDGPDGVKFRVTRQVVQRTIPTTEYQSREQKVYRPQISTEYQSYQQTYLMPVTEYRVVPRLQNWWNPFGGAYWTNSVEPVTRWEARPATVQIPVAKTNWVEETRTMQVPVTTYRTVPEEYTSRVAVSVTPTGSTIPATGGAGATEVASRTIGSQQLQSDPPRTASPWATAPTSDPYRR
jgi:hypothetical protein